MCLGKREMHKFSNLKNKKAALLVAWPSPFRVGRDRLAFGGGLGPRGPPPHHTTSGLDQQIAGWDPV